MPAGSDQKGMNVDTSTLSSQRHQESRVESKKRIEELTKKQAEEDKGNLPSAGISHSDTAAQESRAKGLWHDDATSNVSSLGRCRMLGLRQGFLQSIKDSAMRPPT